MNQKLLLTAGLSLFAVAASASDEKPNIVWIMLEDLADDYFSLYNPLGVKTPNIAKLASEGVIYENAYSNAPVSSAARSTLFTGCYANRIGVAFHRRIKSVNLANGGFIFPKYLQDEGYYTTNSTKTDYNFEYEKGWDNIKAGETAWRDRKDGQPFFHVITWMTTHEGKFFIDPNDPKQQETLFPMNSVHLAPQHPDTKAQRLTYAHLYDKIVEADKQVGNIIEELKKDNLLDNTFIFVMGDNGGNMAGTKGYSCELGLHIPLVAYVPEKYREELGVAAGDRKDGFVSFVDMGPTALSLAGVDKKNIPEGLDGKSFLGSDIKQKEVEKRNEVFCYGERFDELYSFFRTYRKGDYKYVRRFQGFYPKSLYTFYRYKMPAFAEWKELYKQGKLNDVQSRFFEELGGEELYDLKTDPYETKNLALDPVYQSMLKEYRKGLKNKMIELLDVGIFPESEWTTGVGEKSVEEFTANRAYDIKKYINTAELGVIGFDKAKKDILKALVSSDDVERYWALNACLEYGKDAVEIKSDVLKLKNDKRGFIASRAAVFEVMLGGKNPEPTITKAIDIVKSDAELLMILGDVVYLNDERGFNIKPQIKDKKYIDEVGWRMEYINAN
ncbi:MAG: sulfatase [Rikenellaceae bacterium]